MKNLRVAGLALLLLTASALGVRATELTATSGDVIPNHFHWTVQPSDSSYKTYHFDSQHGWWNATLTKGDVTVSEHGIIPVKDRFAFYQGLAANGVWELNTNTKAAPSQPGYYYVVKTERDEHEVTFNGSPAPEYDKLVTYVNGTFVGQEQKALEGRLGSIPTPVKK